jgi:hypothetical protein
MAMRGSKGALPLVMGLAGLAGLAAMLPRHRPKGPGKNDAEDLRAAEAVIARLEEEAAFFEARDEEAERAEAEAREAQHALARREAAQAGFDVDRLDKLAAEEAAKLRARGEAADARAIAASADMVRRLGTLRPIFIPPADPETELIEQVTFIRSFVRQGTVVDSRTAPLDNFARYKFSDGGAGSGTGRLSFFTLWKNPRNRTSRMSVEVPVQVAARLVADALPNLFLGTTSFAHGVVRLQITVIGVSEPGVRAIVADREIGREQVHGGFWGHDHRKTLMFADTLVSSALVLSARALMLIEVSLITEWSADTGEVRLDAHSGSFGMLIPFLSVTTV